MPPTIETKPDAWAWWSEDWSHALSFALRRAALTGVRQRVWLEHGMAKVEEAGAPRV